MPTMEQAPAEELDITRKRHPRRTALKLGALGAAIASAGGFFIFKNGGGQPQTAQTPPQTGRTDGAKGGRGGEDVGIPNDVREVVDLPAFRQIVARVLDVSESTITSANSDRILSTSDTNGHGTLSLFNTSGSLGLSLSFGPRTSRVGTKTLDGLAAHQKTVNRNPDTYKPIAIEGAEAAFYNKVDGVINVFGSETDDFAIGVALSKRNPGVPIGEGGQMGAGPGAEVATRDIAQLIVREYFGS